MADDLRPIPTAKTRAPRGPGPMRFEWSDVIAMCGAGLFGETDRVELIDGEIAIMPDESDLHKMVLQLLVRWLAKNLSSSYELYIRGGLKVSADTHLIPDITVLRANFGLEDLDVSRAGLIIEVSVSTLKNDLGLKCARYATAGAKEVWVVDVLARRIWIHTGPSSEGFLSVQAHEATARIAPLCAPTSTFDIASLPDPRAYE